MLLPEGTKVIVKPDTSPHVTKGGLHIPEIARDQLQHAVTRGTIVALGPDAQVHFCHDNDITGVTKREAKPGDRVIFVKYAGAQINWGKKREPHRILQDADIVCYITDDEVENDSELPDSRRSMVKK